MSIEFRAKKDFGGFKLDMELSAENEVIALLGASGSGKSMFLRCVAGIVTPDEGRIAVNGKVLFDSEKKINLSPQERQVGLLFQNYALFPNMTVEQNIITGMCRFEASKKEKLDICHDMMAKFYLKGLEKHKPSQLSGGQQQRVALARIMVSNPSILMLDEPFSALDSFLRWELEQELMDVLDDFGRTAIIVSHNRNEVYRISSKIAVLNNGSIECYDRKENIFSEPKTYESAILTGCQNFSRSEYIDHTHVKATDWNMVLSLEGGVDTDVKYIAIKSDFIKPASGPGENTGRFRVIKQVENINEMIIVLEAEPSNNSDYSKINVRVTKENWEPFKNSEYLYIEFLEKDVLLLNS